MVKKITINLSCLISDSSNLKQYVSNMISISADALTKAQSESARSREQVKLLLAQFYHDALSNNKEDCRPDFLVEYHYDERHSILKVRSFGKTHIYGYQYLAQTASFCPDLNFAKNAHK